MSDITLFIATEIKAQCLKCNEWLNGWIGNPQGSSTTCDYCNEELSVHFDADIEFDY